jgi:hypothetical protein
MKFVTKIIVLLVSVCLLSGCDGPSNDFVKGVVLGMVHKEIRENTGSSESDGRVLNYEIINDYKEKDDHDRDVYVYEYEVSVEYDLVAKRAYRNRTGKTLGDSGNFSGVLRLFRKGEGWYVILPKE